MALLTYSVMGIGQLVGPVILGFIQDKCGHSSTLSFLMLTTVTTAVLLITLNELNSFNMGLSYMTMFFLGVSDNGIMMYINVAIGFEFKQVLVAFGTKNFLENISLFTFILCLAISPLESQVQYRAFFITFLCFSVISIVLMMRLARSFKDAD